MANAGGIVVAFLSLSKESCVDQLIERINTKHGLHCTFVKLTHRDLQSFVPQDEYDAVVLLHSISQGRNSITDVADAKYNKLLLKLKETYGPDRVGVIVHSMTSYSPVSKSALMMVFKKSQPTTFKCSHCVIQCNNPATMEDEHISRLIEFLKNAPHHEKPKPLLEGSTSAARLSEATTTNMPRPKQSHSSGKIPETKSTSASSHKNSVTRHEGSSDNENTALQITRGKGEGQEVLEHTAVSARSERKTQEAKEDSTSAADAPMEIKDSKEETEVLPYIGSSRIPPATIDRHMSPIKAGKADMSSLPRPLSQDPHQPSVSLIGSGSYIEKAGGSDSSGPSQHRNTTSSGDAYSSAAVKGYPQPNSHGYGQATSAMTQPSAPSKSTVDQRVDQVMASKQRNIDEKCLLLAFLDFSRSVNQSVSDAVKDLFPQKTLMRFGGWKELKRNWHLYTAILIDVGTSPNPLPYKEFDKALMACLKNTYNRQNVAVLLPATPTSPISEPERVCYFRYCPKSGTFSDDAKTNLVHWLSDCSLRHGGYLHPKESDDNYYCGSFI
ncbi:uncharacterized protein LOC129266937 isoform X2 [Lytechinus pictus]|uniref:uncharacterized protein LOC129266937 isoform X2 n=1 Tax=Lytechinus pictus TaxID=7653 RepID=UPI0030B9C7F3